jgi:hypothetical protein
LGASGSQTITNNLVVLGGISLDGTGGVLLASGSMDLSGADRTLDIAGVVTISGTVFNGALNKSGSGELILSME